MENTELDFFKGDPYLANNFETIFHQFSESIKEYKHPITKKIFEIQPTIRNIEMKLFSTNAKKFILLPSKEQFNLFLNNQVFFYFNYPNKFFFRDY